MHACANIYTLAYDRVLVHARMYARLVGPREGCLQALRTCGSQRGMVFYLLCTCFWYGPLVHCSDIRRPNTGNQGRTGLLLCRVLSPYTGGVSLRQGTQSSGL